MIVRLLIPVALLLVLRYIFRGCPHDQRSWPQHDHDEDTTLQHCLLCGATREYKFGRRTQGRWIG